MVRASLMRKLENIDDPKLRDVLISFLEEAERIIGETITRTEFREFVNRTEKNFDRVWKAIGELTERVNSLAEAQKRTEERLEKLIGEHKKTREHLGGLSNAFGYVLEDRAIKGLPSILNERFNIELTEPLRRDVIEIGDGKEIELNIIGKGKVDGKEIIIIGESKAQSRKRDIDKFLNYVKTLNKYLTGEKFLIMITYQTPSKVRRYAEEKGINLIYSYELPLI